MRTWLFIAIVVVLATAIFPARAYRLEYKDAPHVKRVYDFQLGLQGKMSMPGEPTVPIDVKITFTAVERVSVARRGSQATITLETRDGVLSGKVGEKTMQQFLPRSTVTFSRSPQGAVSSVKVGGNAPTQNAKTAVSSDEWQYISQFSQFTFPATEMEVGDFWGQRQTMELLPGNKLTSNTRHEIIGTVAVDGKTYLQLASDISMMLPKQALPLDSLLPFPKEKLPPLKEKQAASMSIGMKATGKSDLLFDVEDGEIFRQTFSSVLTLSMDFAQEKKVSSVIGNLTINGTVTKRQPEDE